MIQMVITTAGRNAIVNAKQTGLNAVTIDSIAVGSGRYTPTADMTRLNNETKRSKIIEGGSNGDNSIHVAFRDDTEVSYSIYEFGVFLDDGTLFAIYSSNELLLQKSVNSVAFLAVDIALDDIDVHDITFGDVTFTTAAATTENAGVVVLATDAEVSEGADVKKVLTVKNLKALAAGEGKAGLVKIATDTEAMGGKDTTSAITPKQTQAKILSYAATNAETQTGAIANKFVTPQGLRATKASESQLGVVRFAATAQAVAGTSTDVAMSPKTVKESIAANVKDGTQSQKGVVQLAPDSAAVSGTSTTLAVTPSGLKAAIKDTVKDIEIDSVSRVANSGGKGAFSLYPSGVSVMHQERAGTNQFAMARFSDDDAGNSLVFFKSRATTARQSKSILSGDKIGWISFLADNGNINYGETLQGARAAMISGGVFESSSITSAGTKNLGVRGFIRLLACSDEDSRDGKGLEIIDNAVRPTVDNNSNLGTAGRRWKTIYAMSDVIATSDEKYKQDIAPLGDTKDVAVEMAKLICQFRFKSDVAEDGADAKYFVGIIAQRLNELLNENGFTNSAMIKHDTNDDGEEVLGVRYRDFFAFILNGLSQYAEKLDSGKQNKFSHGYGLIFGDLYAWNVPMSPMNPGVSYVAYTVSPTIKSGDLLFDANGDILKVKTNADTEAKQLYVGTVIDGTMFTTWNGSADRGIATRDETKDVAGKTMSVDIPYIIESLQDEFNNVKPLILECGDTSYTFAELKSIIEGGRDVIVTKDVVVDGANVKTYNRVSYVYDQWIEFSCSYIGSATACRNTIKYHSSGQWIALRASQMIDKFEEI